MPSLHICNTSLGLFCSLSDCLLVNIGDLGQVSSSTEVLFLFGLSPARVIQALTCGLDRVISELDFAIVSHD